MSPEGKPGQEGLDQDSPMMGESTFDLSGLGLSFGLRSRPHPQACPCPRFLLQVTRRQPVHGLARQCSRIISAMHSVRCAACAERVERVRAAEW